MPGAKAPTLVNREMLAAMRPGSVVVDIAIDQGGCFETSRTTTHSDPRTSRKVSSTTAWPTSRRGRPHLDVGADLAALPYLVKVAQHGVHGAVHADAALRLGLSTLAGKLVSEPVTEAHELSSTDPAELLATR